MVRRPWRWLATSIAPGGRLDHAAERVERAGATRWGAGRPFAVIAGQRGFTLVELLVAATITLAVTGALLAAMNPADGVFSSELEAADQQQRLRVAVGVFVKDLVMAELVLPCRCNRTGDPPATFRADAVTVMYSLSSAKPTLATALPAESGQARINIGPGCPLNDAVCGLSRASTVLASDDTRSIDAFHVDDVQDTVLVLRHTMSDSAKSYAPGSRLVHAVVRSYFLKVDTSADSVQLVRDDGNGAVVPVVDHVVALGLEYFGGASNTERLDASVLADGPWLPDAGAPSRFDADLLRVRSIAVTIRVESALATLRGPAGPLFSRGGTSRRGSRFLPDLQMRVHVSPRNLGNIP
jgi:prepilin-type N-terminal cleavage/methylation domain-containing protein